MVIKEVIKNLIWEVPSENLLDANFKFQRTLKNHNINLYQKLNQQVVFKSLTLLMKAFLFANLSLLHSSSNSFGQTLHNILTHLEKPFHAASCNNVFPCYLNKLTNELVMDVKHHIYTEILQQVLQHFSLLFPLRAISVMLCHHLR